LLQKLIQSIGWMGAMWAMAVAALATLPLIGKLAGPASTAPQHADDSRLGAAVLDALKNPSYWLLHAGFFTCGFHIAFLVTHLPGEVNLCGLPPSVASWSLAIIGLANVFGSLYAGSCVARYRSKYVLAAMYGSRALLIVWYLWMPRTELTYYLFAAGLGFTWLATVPPTAAIVGKLFGTRYLATLFGLTLLSHQIGGFLGAWLGGITISRFGDFSWMWYADITLAIIAALVNLPIKEDAIAKPQLNRPLIAEN
jgi:predicted MFS family arabinose efflux permease